jgi:VanZ family protein
VKTLVTYFASHRWPAIVWTLLIVVACTLPGKSIPDAPIMGFDKIVHIGMFIGWTCLWLLLFPRSTLFIALLGIAFGIFLEFYQQWLPFDRTFDWWDAAADGVGVLVGLGLFFILMRYLPRPSQGTP